VLGPRIRNIKSGESQLKKLDREYIRTRRTLEYGSRFRELSQSSSMTAMVGLYNAEQYLENIEHELLNQTDSEVPIIFVDNYSGDNTWEFLKNFSPELLSKSCVVRNPMNLGGLGSLYLNLDLVASPWVTTVHQDDVYLENHFSTLKAAVNNAKVHNVCFFTDMGSVSGESGSNPERTLIRPSWILDSWLPKDVFLANLKLQNVSFPSSVFRVSALLETEVPWHSSTFNDTEITLMLSTTGTIIPIWETTMLYRLNPRSESQDLTSPERILGSALSLLRVMNSPGFTKLIQSLEHKHRAIFAKNVFFGIEARLGKCSLAELVTLAASESMGKAWGYNEVNTREYIETHFESFGGARTTDLLKNLGEFYGDKRTGKWSNNHDNLLVESASALLNVDLPSSHVGGSQIQKRTLRMISELLPLKIRRVVTKRLVGIATLFNPKSPWRLK
jgi:glycosyltransferase involved in cell wall biosynthesis